MPTFYSVRAVREGVGGTLRINDVPLAHWEAASSGSSMDAINMWITGRANRVTMMFDWPATARVGNPQLELEIVATTRNPGAPESAPVKAFHWPRAEDQSTRPPSIAFEFDVPDAPPSTLWRSLAPLALDAANRSAAQGAVADLNAAFDTHDLERVASLLEFKALDVGAALYFTPDGARRSQRDFLEFFLERPTFRMEPLDPQLRLELVADRRLVMVSRADGSPALMSRRGGGPQMILPVYVAPLNGRWTVVR